MVKGVHHFALAVKDLEKSLKFYTEVLGLKSRTMEMSEYKVKLAIIEVNGVLVELIQPTGPGDAFGFSEFIEQNGEGFHHMAYEVEDVLATVQMLKANGISLLNEEPKKGADGQIVFAEKQSMGGVLVEFVEPPTS